MHAHVYRKHLSERKFSLFLDGRQPQGYHLVESMTKRVRQSYPGNSTSNEKSTLYLHAVQRVTERCGFILLNVHFLLLMGREQDY